LQPYIYEIENLKQRLREREVELTVIKNAIFGIDGKFTEIEKKAKTPAATTGAARTGGRAVATAGSSSTRGGVAAKAPTT
jgi:ribosomal protein L10